MTRPNNSTLKNVAFYAVCFTFSIAFFVALAEAGHVYPFGDNSFLTNDLNTNTSTSSRGFAASF